ncbi:hypothetical protein Pmani_031299 [Petrolisthes manimaculis]|uniref:Uncharacterized protein n=1 Tax=Petrolisthes manimaculis TaxID=1843537 RepID=A0AAE1NVM3_9EUCA|nr:hypothetical protein Pmani_031299 [Petrolisthes manimaculis]
MGQVGNGCGAEEKKGDFGWAEERVRKRCKREKKATKEIRYDVTKRRRQEKESQPDMRKQNTTGTGK